MSSYRDLAPGIFRQRLVIEGFPAYEISSADIILYLSELTDVLAMKPLIAPVTNHSREYGWAGWIHWESSGAHFYAWNKHHPRSFFSVDIYTCKAFNPQAAIIFTRAYFQSKELTYKEF